MPRARIGRRTMLRGMLGGAAVGISLPLLDVFLNDNGDALAQGGGLPKRFGIFFWGNGTIPDKWNPTTAGADWELTEQLENLGPVRQHLTLVSGMAVKTANTVAHSSGAAGIFTGASLLQGPQGDTLSGPSLDQIIADAIGGETRFRSIETSCDNGDSWSFTGPYSRNPAETSPHALFERIFGAGFRAPGDVPIIDPSIGLRRSVLDVVGDDVDRLRPRLGAADRVRLDKHLEGIRGLELQLARLEADPPNLAACMRPAEPLLDYPPIEGRAQLSKLNHAMSDVLAMALACDQTRVFSHWFTRSVTDVLFDGASDGHHRLTHDEPGDQPEVNDIVKLIMAELAYTVSVLASVQEGDGTLLDNMVMLATSDCSLGRQHRLADYPIILAGSAGGKIKNGWHHKSAAQDNTSKVLLTLVQAMGLTAESFGTGAGQVGSGLGEIEL